MVHKDDKKLAGAMYAGFWMIGVGLLLVVLSVISLYFFVAGVVMFLLGLVVSAISLATGLSIEKRAKASGTVMEIPDAQIVGRYAISEIGEMLFSDLDIDFDNPKTKLYIRIHPPGAASLELRTNAPVWQSCGEGMRGTALLQGDWLGGFTPSLGQGEGDPHQR